MEIGEYHSQIHIPAYGAVQAMRRFGLRVDLNRAKKQAEDWEKELKKLEKYVEGEAKKGKWKFEFKYSEKHQPKPDEVFREWMYHHHGLGLEVSKVTPGKGLPSTDDEALLPYAAVGPNHWEDDHPVVYAILMIKSIAKANGTHLNSLIKWRSGDGCCHPTYRWSLENTTRISAEDPPVHQLPEKKNPEIAQKVKSVIVPRVSPCLGPPEDWDPRKHGWVAKADVSGAEAVIRAGCIAECGVSQPYLREGKDIHSKTASILYQVPEGTFGKGTPEREKVGKTSYFLLIFGGSSYGLQNALWIEARVWQEEDEAEKLYHAFFDGYPDLQSRYYVDTRLCFERGYIEDFYGRRWKQPPPHGVTIASGKTGTGDLKFDFPKTGSKDEHGRNWSRLSHIRHTYANRPTQAAQATTTLWCVALCYYGEYVELKAPEYWNGELLFPEVKDVKLDGRSIKVWPINTVHDSLWLDGAPGTLETAAKVVTRRFNGVPADFLLEKNMPWRVEMLVGPDLGHLEPYNTVAKRFGLELLPSR